MSKRKENESFEDYKKRRKEEKKKLKSRMKGKVVWESGKYGTFVKSRDGDLR